MAYGNKPITYPADHCLLETKLYREVQALLDGKIGADSVTRKVLEEVFKVRFKKPRAAKSSKAARLKAVRPKRA